MFRVTTKDLIILAVIGAIAAGGYAYYHQPRLLLAEKIRDAALAQAKKEGKLVLLVFGVHGDVWSDRLDTYHADPEVHKVLEKHFVLTRVDIKEAGGTEMYLERGLRGTPAFSILDRQGKVVADSGQEGQNFGFPNNPEEVDRYLAALKSACPRLSDDEVAVLRQKLEQMRVPRPDETGSKLTPAPSAAAPGCRTFLRTARRFA